MRWHGGVSLTVRLIQDFWWPAVAPWAFMAGLFHLWDGLPVTKRVAPPFPAYSEFNRSLREAKQYNVVAPTSQFKQARGFEPLLTGLRPW